MSRSQFSIYIHLPYCVKKCPYCDFNSYGVGSEPLGEREERYVAAVLNELRTYSEDPAWQGRGVKTVFFGGGTPSLFSSHSFAQILGTIAEGWHLTAPGEITVECNPGTVQEELGSERLEGFLRAGINRLSFGAQSFSSRKLALLGRIHSGGETVHAVQTAKRVGFTNFNLDLMFGTAGESFAEWSHDLRAILELEPTHISAYGLTIEPGTEFGRDAKRGVVFTAEEDLQAELYEHTQDTLERAGYGQYEISNYAKPGSECAHNLNYWRGGDYLAIGAGAHGYLRGSAPMRWANIPGPEHYIAQVRDRGVGEHRREVIDREKSELEFFSLRLRTAEGVQFSEYYEEFGERFEERFAPVFTELQALGLLAVDSFGARLTKRGMLFADTVFSAFVER